MWKDWKVCSNSGFEVHTSELDAVVPLLQVGASAFNVGAPFRFVNSDVTAKLVDHLGRVGAFKTDVERREAVERASVYTPGSNSTDLASIPPFLRWFENTYGKHTLAAIIHDRQIDPKVNGGDLKSDVVADRFFREMLHACQTPLVKRWVMWTAVAMRTRWKASPWKKAKMVLWMIAACAGIAGSWRLWSSVGVVTSVGFGLGMLVISAGLWGRQWGAAVFTAVALPLIFPAAVLALLATGGFALVELAAKRFDRPLPRGI